MSFWPWLLPKSMSGFMSLTKSRSVLVTVTMVITQDTEDRATQLATTLTSYSIRGELTLSLTSCSTQEMGPSILPEHHNQADSVEEDIGNLTCKLV